MGEYFWLILSIAFLSFALGGIGAEAEYNALKKQCKRDDEYYDGLG